MRPRRGSATTPAASEIQQALVRDPKSPDLQVEVARWMAAHGHAEEGVRWARKVLADRPTPP